MILTGREIAREVNNGAITIEPMVDDNIQPNSYDFRLGHIVGKYTERVLDAKNENPFEEMRIPEEGMVLNPGTIYLGHTLEIMGSSSYVPIIRAKSSVARLGLFIHVTADLIDIGSVNQFTLQLNPVQPVRVYPEMLIGQVTFWTIQGQVTLYSGKYQGSMGPKSSKSFLDFE